MFDSLRSFSDVLSRVAGPHNGWRTTALARQKVLTKPPGSLGRIEDVAIFLAGWGHEEAPRAERMRLVVFAGNHGVTAQGVSPYPSDVTGQMVANFKAGGAASNAFTSAVGLGFDVIEVADGQPTGDITREDAMSAAELLDAINVGAGAIRADDDVVVLGEMGIGNTTIAATLCARTFGGDGALWAGPGTGLNDAGVAHKAGVIDRALAFHRAAHGSEAMSAVETLRRVGGRETAAIAGAVVAARQMSVPIVLDGYVVGASVAPLFNDNASIVDHCLAGHVSAEPAHANLLKAMSLEPLLDLSMRLGEGTGGVLACALLKAACAAHNGMATFDEAQVAGRVDG